MTAHDSTPDLSAPLERLVGWLSRASVQWMRGGRAPDDPLFVADAPRDASALELERLAFAAQLQYGVVCERTTERLRVGAPLPELALPLLDASLRGSFRRLIGVAHTQGREPAVIEFLYRRGVMAHPFDWLPAAQAESLPEVYWALQAWVAGHESVALDALNDQDEAHWQAMSAAARRAALKVLRARAPEHARALIESLIGAWPADERRRTLELIGIGLSAADAPWLERLHAQDRSEKVRTVAFEYLCRLGHAANTEALDALLAGLDHRALERPTRRIAFRAHLTLAERQRIAQCSSAVSAHALADRLGLSLEACVDAWAIDDPWAREVLFAMLSGETRARDAAERLWARLLADGVATFSHWQALCAGWTDAQAQAQWLAVIEHGVFALESVLIHSGSALDPCRSAALLTSEIVETGLREYIGARDRAPPHGKSLSMFDLGLLLQRADAQCVLERLLEAGFSRHDPALITLSFNTMLPEQSERMAVR